MNELAWKENLPVTKIIYYLLLLMLITAVIIIVTDNVSCETLPGEILTGGRGFDGSLHVPGC